jgi:hypothetical protein
MARSRTADIDFAELLLEQHSRRITDTICNAIGDDTTQFAKIIEIVYSSAPPLPQRASWIIAVKARENPQLVQPYIEKFLDTFDSFTVDGIRRNIMQAIAHAEIPEERQAELFDRCLELIRSAKEPVAIKAWAMEAAARICEEFPELLHEFKAAVLPGMENNSPAYAARARLIFKRLERGPASSSSVRKK